MEPNITPDQQQTSPIASATAATGAPQSVASEHKKTAPLIVILSVILVLIIAGLYVFALNSGGEAVPYDDMTPTPEVQPITNTDDDIGSIQADLDASIDGLDSQSF